MMTAAGTLTDYTVPVSYMDVGSGSNNSITIKITITHTVLRNVTPDCFGTGKNYHLVYEIVSAWRYKEDPYRGKLFNPNNYFVESGYIKSTA